MDLQRGNEKYPLFTQNLVIKRTIETIGEFICKTGLNITHYSIGGYHLGLSDDENEVQRIIEYAIKKAKYNYYEIYNLNEKIKIYNQKPKPKPLSQEEIKKRVRKIVKSVSNGNLFMCFRFCYDFNKCWRYDN